MIYVGLANVVKTILFRFHAAKRKFDRVKMQESQI